MIKVLAAAVAIAFVCGCEGIGRRVVSDPGENQVLRVVSGDRLYFSLDENASAGFEWDYTCDDGDVTVTIDRFSPGRADVRIRVHRGYDGPSTVIFRLRRTREKSPPVKEFTITLYKRTGDVAFWE